MTFTYASSVSIEIPNLTTHTTTIIKATLTDTVTPPSAPTSPPTSPPSPTMSKRQDLWISKLS